MGVGALNAVSYSFDEVVNMFVLSDIDLKRRILHYNAGISSFAATLHFRQGYCIAMDSLYAQTADQIEQTIQSAQKKLIQEMQHHPERFVLHQNTETWITAHEARHHLFLDDFEDGRLEKRYIAGQLPNLPFEDEAFDLVLVPHHFFTEDGPIEMMINDLIELTRVANEVRIFPLVDDKAQLNDKVGQLAAILQQQSMGVEIKASHFELQKHGNALMRVFHPSCSLSAHQKHQGS